MAEAVKTDRRTERARRTEERILEAARGLFLANGYARTTLEAVALAADVAPRTLYVRFNGKADLLKRVVDVAVAGDTRAIDVFHREWFQRSLTAPTLAERIRAQATGTAALMARAAELIAVAEQAAAEEPSLADAHAAGRAATHAGVRRFWERAKRDRLLPPNVAVGSLAATSAVLLAPPSYLELRRTLGWSDARYRRWIVETLGRLAA